MSPHSHISQISTLVQFGHTISDVEMDIYFLTVTVVVVEILVTNNFGGSKHSELLHWMLSYQSGKTKKTTPVKLLKNGKWCQFHRFEASKMARTKK